MSTCQNSWTMYLCFVADLGSESGKHITKLLDRVSKRQRKSRKLTPKDGQPLLDPVARSRLQCGAPAAKQEQESNPDLESVWEDVEDNNVVSKDVEDNGLVVRLEADVRKAKAKQVFTQADRDLCKQMHRAHLMCLLARGVVMDTIADDTVLQAAALSHIPEELITRCFDEAKSWSKILLYTLTDVFAKIFHFQPRDDMPEIPVIRQDDDLLQRFLEKVSSCSCSVEEYTVIFASVLRALGYPVRIVTCLNPMAFRPAELLKQMNQSEKKYQKRKKKDTKEGKQSGASDVKTNDPISEGHNQRKCDSELEREIALAVVATSWMDVDKPEKRASKKPVVNSTVSSSSLVDQGAYWLEVFCGGVKDGEWIHCDPVNRWIHAPDKVHVGFKKRHSLAYVAAFGGGGAKDVTRRYASNFASIKKNRENEWWDKTMSILRRKEQAGMRKAFSKSNVVRDPTLADIMDQRENKVLEQKVEEETKSLPTTIEGFKNHKEFVLKRHITKYQILVPGCKAHGAHKGEPFYLKSDLRDIHTAERWKRLGREVKSTEIDFPCKMIKKKGAPSANSGMLDGEPDLGNNEQAMSRYYADWQTDPWCPPAAQDGKVPKNDRGNVEVPPFAFQMPLGTVHVELPHAAKVCKKLQIDFAPALTGFDIRGGRSVPRIEGVVVCQEFEQVVESACHEYQRHQAELAKQKRLKQGEEAWRDFVKALLTHVRVQKSYAGDDIELNLLQNASLRKDPAEAKTGKRQNKKKKQSGPVQNPEQHLDNDPSSFLEMEEI